jgi:hypothetical protein
MKAETRTTTGIRDEHIDPAPTLGPRSRRMPRRLVVEDIDRDPRSSAARCLNLGHLEAFEHREDIVV